MSVDPSAREGCDILGAFCPWQGEVSEGLIGVDKF
jgi:hypothetical protein